MPRDKALQEALKPGGFKVTRDCCTSGNCIQCITARKSDRNLKFGQTIRVTQLDNLTAERAQIVAHNWRAYNAVVEPA